MTGRAAPPADPALVERVRTEVQRAVRVLSLRHVADDVGMSPTGLARFADRNGTPQRETWCRLCLWIVRRAVATPGRPSQLAHDVAVDLLTSSVPADQREALREGVEELIARLLAEHGAPEVDPLPEPRKRGGPRR